MFNLSDKELDRLSQEAASVYDPGDPAGPGSWERLEQRLDKELGGASPNPNPLHAIRRIPFYFAPAILLLAGVSYYFVKQAKNNTRSTPPASPVIVKTEPSGSPPAVVRTIRPGQVSNKPSIQTKNNSDKSTSTPDQDRSTGNTKYNPSPDRENTAGLPAANTESNTHSGRITTLTPNAPTQKDITAAPSASTRNGIVSAPPDRNGIVSAPPHRNGIVSAPPDTRTAAGYSAERHSLSQQSRGNRPSGSYLSANRGHKDHSHGNANNDPHRNTNSDASGNAKTSPVLIPDKDQTDQNGAATVSALPGYLSTGPRDPLPFVIRGPQSRLRPPVVDDSALRNFTAKEGDKNPALINIDKKKNPSLRIDRTLQFGFSIAPDFASVNSLAGDKPGSATGITIDYQFFNRWYISTGLLFSRKNYTAQGKDYHVPHDYYWMNNMRNIDFVKGSFNMLEIPLNLRYDFSVAGNTTFFASGGFSSYLLTRENCNYYYSLFGREASRRFNYQANQSHLFSAINLSLGMETGISNSFSILVAPYMKLPSGKIGFGQIEMNSIGINFALKYAPVIKRKRH